MNDRPRDPDDSAPTTETHAYRPKAFDDETDVASTSVHRPLDATTDPNTGTSAFFPNVFTEPTPSAAAAPTVDLDGDVRASSSAYPVNIHGFDILGETGRGGMGVVFKARQLDLNRLVAIKMVLADKFERPEDLVRFRLEAEMVARVHHPNVVQVYDSGAWQGHPYLVLEWVEGGTLGSYLTEKPQPPEVGARTIGLLARAIHAAHCNGVIHRDLKPSNILVARGGESGSGPTRPVASAPSTVNRHDTLSATLTLDGESVTVTPKIADFGIAKQLVGATHLTETGKILGTPAYMAPEQAEGRSDLTGPATDVYALGVILYQMLTGRTPFRGVSHVQLLKRVIEEEPRRLRAVDPKVPRDLETICLKCLEKFPLRRYETAEALANDLDCFLDGRPIAARPAGTIERVWKWAQRRPGVAALSIAAALFLVLGFAGVTWQWKRAVAAERIVVDQRDRAIGAEQALRTEKAVTDAVNHFLLDDLLATAAPEKSLGRKVTVEEVLQNASARIEGTFRDQPEVAAAVRLALGNSYRKLGLFGPASRHLEAGLDIRRNHLGATHRDTLQAAADRGLLLADQRNWAAAIPLLRQVVGDARDHLGLDDSATIEATTWLAGVLQEQGATTEAERLFRDALATSRRVFGAADARTLTVLNDLGMLLRATKRLGEAEAAFREAADGRVKALAPTHPAALESRQNLAVVLDDEGRWAEAKPLYQRVLADKQRVLGRAHIDTLATMNNLADELDRHGEPDAALPLLEEALNGFREALGPENPVTLKVQNNLGQFVFRLGQRGNRPDLRARAETLMAAVLEIRRRVLPPGHPDTLLSANDLAAVLIVLNRLDDAEPLVAEALAGRRKAFGPGNPDTLQTVANYVQLLNRRQKRTEAVAECKAALAAANTASTAESANAIVLLNLMVELLAKGRPADALAPAERAVVLTRKVHGEATDEALRARRNIGGVLLDLGRPADAEPHLRAVHDAYRNVGPTDIRTVQAAGKLGACLLALKQYADAEPLLVGYFDSIRGARGVPKPAIRSAGEQVVKLYEGWDKPEKAAEWREKLK